VLQADPLIVAIAAAIVGVTFLLAAERQSVDSLRIPRVSATEVPLIDGEASDAIWRKVPPVYVVTDHGGNLDGKGETTVSIHAVHDGEWGYFLFVWDDPTRSLKQLPLVKSADGWRLLHDGYAAGDERSYNEDKFAVLLTKLDAVMAGDRTFHAGPASAPGKPRTLSGRGLHYTNDEGSFVDVWQWKATSTSPSGFMDDDYFGPPEQPTKVQLDGKAPYKGGFAPDPGTASYLDNFEPQLPEGYGQPIVPRRLPKDFRATTAALGQVDLDPNHGESDGARWYMTEAESAPYSAELDAQIPVGTIIPGVIMSGAYSGDRADVRCAARWAAGRWALEVARRLQTNSPYDTPISTGTFMRVAAFDHSQIRHTRHVRPLRLELE
jgi:Ethylbenzene dehydrogenase